MDYEACFEKISKIRARMDIFHRGLEALERIPRDGF